MAFQGIGRHSEEIKKLMEETFSAQLEDFRYNGEEAKLRSKTISDAILKAIKNLKIPRYK